MSVPVVRRFGSVALDSRIGLQRFVCRNKNLGVLGVTVWGLGSGIWGVGCRAEGGG